MKTEKIAIVTGQHNEMFSDDDLPFGDDILSWPGHYSLFNQILIILITQLL